MATATNYLKLSNATIFYRTAGSPTKPTILLLHGFPTSSHMFRNLIPILSQQYHVVAPDFPAFGFTTPAADYEYTFANLAATLGEFLDALSIKTFSMYIFDYGAPIGLRLALSRPNAVSALIVQNGNAYNEGLGDALKGPLSQAWASQSREDREMLRAGFLSYEATKSQYELGTPKPETIAPESYTLDFALLNNPEKQEILLDLFMDYKTNVELYQKFHEWLRTSQPPTLVTWGKNDVFFIAQGAEAYKKDVPNAEIHMLDAGHFAGETETAEIGGLILAFLKKNGI
jgi:pimeloyl-ACP methyl ester carboxylesterase